MKVSLVMSTLGRIDEVLQFIHALQQLDHNDFELIIVDQNADERLQMACSAVSVDFPIHYLRSPHAKGCSRGRNMGVAKASGEILCFPDDDCLYPPSLIRKVLGRFDETGSDIVCGRAAAPDGRSINGRFETSAQPVDLRNVFTTQIEWVVFFRREVFEKLEGFDEDIGVGASTPWQSCEGPDITIRAIHAGFKVYYDPELYAHHPELNTRDPDDAMRAKGRRYARGMGHVIRKHSYGILYLTNYLVRPIGGACLSLLKGNLKRGFYYLNVAMGRAEGYAGVCLDGGRFKKAFNLGSQK
ncbi:glycosyltransferase family 2 protein [Variovorax sp. J22R115]|uniref:glycosyltransferase family 2 protein n=1 Tax=Variovorax sp. J22R115 TaxID=3053509 RepID=UPI0025773FF6|nr:glycosyltransferase family 2 protein [Variovorax sp. J22R115]MDM0049444.1 glycosyltransferase family 2 protein [Variovorax sp. J22R115]